MGTILAVDDESGIREMLRIVLSRDGHSVQTAASAGEALELVAITPFELVLTDLRMAPMDGLELLGRLRKASPDCFVVVMTAFAEWDTAVRAMRAGAFTFVRKPFDNAHLKATVNRALAARDRHLAAKGDGHHDPAVHLVGASPSIHAIHQLIDQVATTDSTVLVTGESGTGKELVARAVHQQSKRADKPLQIVNCAAIAENLVESTLFGHVKGAFTGADENRPGVFELADGATLFLDEVGELPLGTQAKLLRALEQGEIQRVGDGGLRKVDVRLIAATNRDLAEEAKAGRFREDLYHRLNVLVVTLPPLRERPADIEALIDHFLGESAKRLGQPAKRLAPESRTLLLRFPWPGNVRQLRNVLERSSIMATGAQIMPADLPPELKAEAATVQLDAPMSTLAAVEKAHVLRVLERCAGNKKQAAEILGIDRSTLYAKLKQYGVA